MRKTTNSSLRASSAALALYGTIAIGTRMFGAGVASAQSVEVQAAPVQPAQPTVVVQPVQPAQPTVVVEAAQPPPSTVVVQQAQPPVVVQPPPNYGPRLRLGLEAGGGGAWGEPRGPAIGAFGQLGIQLADQFAIFYQPSLLAHALAKNDHADMFLAWGNFGMVDVTVGMLQFGVGGGVDVGKFASCTSRNDCVTGERTVNPAIGGRVAALLTLGQRGRMGTRMAIPIAFHVHSTFIDSNQRLTALILTIGVQAY